MRNTGLPSAACRSCPDADPVQCLSKVQCTYTWRRSIRIILLISRRNNFPGLTAGSRGRRFRTRSRLHAMDTLSKHHFSTATSRRTIVRTGAKLLYATPIVAATTRLATHSAGAISGECTAGANCRQDFEPTCGPSKNCECAQTKSHGIACVEVFCSRIPCTEDSDCDSGMCITVPGCCGDNDSFCANPCPSAEADFRSSTQTRGWRQ